MTAPVPDRSAIMGRPLLVGILGGAVMGELALLVIPLSLLRSYALRAKRRARTIGLVVSAAPWVLGDFPIYLVAGGFSGAAGAFLAPWVLHGLPRRAPSRHG